jgi:hypothetical protein
MFESGHSIAQPNSRQHRLKALRLASWSIQVQIFSVRGNKWLIFFQMAYELLNGNPLPFQKHIQGDFAS